MISSLLTHNHGMFLHLFRSSQISPSGIPRALKNNMYIVAVCSALQMSVRSSWFIEFVMIYHVFISFLWSRVLSNC